MTGGSLVLKLTPILEYISKIERTASLTLIMKYHANPGVNRTENGATTAASIKWSTNNHLGAWCGFS